MFGADVWGIEIRDVGYLHARSGAAQAWLLLGDRDQARTLAEAELADARVSGGRRALGIALRVAGLATGGADGLERLSASVDVLRESPALLERAKSIAELGAALRRAGQRVAARPLLTEALDLAAGCGARPLASRLHAELAAAGGRPAPGTPPRPGRPHPERAAGRPAGRGRPDQPADRARAVRDAEDRRDPPGPRLRQARDLAPRRAPRGAGRRKPRGTHPDANRGPLAAQWGHHLSEGDPR